MKTYLRLKDEGSILIMYSRAYFCVGGQNLHITRQNNVSEKIRVKRPENCVRRDLAQNNPTDSSGKNVLRVYLF
jgi:hypothetical protein